MKVFRCWRVLDIKGLVVHREPCTGQLCRGWDEVCQACFRLAKHDEGIAGNRPMNEQLAGWWKVNDTQRSPALIDALVELDIINSQFRWNQVPSLSWAQASPFSAKADSKLHRQVKGYLVLTFNRIDSLASLPQS